MSAHKAGRSFLKIYMYLSIIIGTLPTLVCPLPRREKENRAIPFKVQRLLVTMIIKLATEWAINLFNEMKWNEMKWNEMKMSQQNRNFESKEKIRLKLQLLISLYKQVRNATVN